MSKKNKEVTNPKTITLVPEGTEVTALTMVKSEGLYSVLKLTIKDGEVTNSEMIHTPDVKAIAAESFKITAARTFLVNG